MQHSSFLDVLLTGGPNNFNGSGFIFKNPKVTFLPNVPDEEPREELPKSVEDGILIRVIMLVLDGVSNITLLSISSSA